MVVEEHVVDSVELAGVDERLHAYGNVRIFARWAAVVDFGVVAGDATATVIVVAASTSMWEAGLAAAKADVAEGGG